MLQTRLPLEPQSIFPGLSGGFKMHDLRRHWEKKSYPPRASEPAPQRSQTSSLFSLPTELRLEIYARVLPTLDQTTEIVPLNQDSARVTTKVGHEKTGPRDLTKCNVLRVCKAVHNEALELLYHNITYRFAATKTLYLFLRHIGSRGRQLLKSIDVLCGSREDAITFSLLATCEKLRSIRIRLPRPMILWPGAPIWSIDGMGALLMLSGLEEVKFGDCGPRFKTCMDEDKSDAAVLRRELTRPKQEPSRVRWVNYQLDI
ncbi:hypothetical protein Tdes44962_MAKER03673 [Teratosphaeria destructans]|uniref:F-box domain-containing protein n=1 Tax=Teratosphaeria destructans TaxID=418781 RepID=A0A9W7SP30_9PEZI|nr:hypothetical protein Tdes44962_MAKER03673 [Teratosphaeria destructans]